MFKGIKLKYILYILPIFFTLYSCKMGGPTSKTIKKEKKPVCEENQENSYSLESHLVSDIESLSPAQVTIKNPEQVETVTNVHVEIETKETTGSIPPDYVAIMFCKDNTLICQPFVTSQTTDSFPLSPVLFGVINVYWVSCVNHERTSVGDLPCHHLQKTSFHREGLNPEQEFLNMINNKIYSLKDKLYKEAWTVSQIAKRFLNDSRNQVVEEEDAALVDVATQQVKSEGQLGTYLSSENSDEAFESAKEQAEAVSNSQGSQLAGGTSLASQGFHICPFRLVGDALPTEENSPPNPQEAQELMFEMSEELKEIKKSVQNPMSTTGVKQGNLPTNFLSNPFSTLDENEIQKLSLDDMRELLSINVTKNLNEALSFILDALKKEEELLISAGLEQTKKIFASVISLLDNVSTMLAEIDRLVQSVLETIKPELKLAIQDVVRQIASLVQTAEDLLGQIATLFWEETQKLWKIVEDTAQQVANDVKETSKQANQAAQRTISLWDKGVSWLDNPYHIAGSFLILGGAVYLRMYNKDFIDQTIYGGRLEKRLTVGGRLFYEKEMTLLVEKKKIKDIEELDRLKEILGKRKSGSQTWLQRLFEGRSTTTLQPNWWLNRKVKKIEKRIKYLDDYNQKTTQTLKEELKNKINKKETELTYQKSTIRDLEWQRTKQRGGMAAIGLGAIALGAGFVVLGLEKEGSPGSVYRQSIANLEKEVIGPLKKQQIAWKWLRDRYVWQPQK